MKVNLLSSFPSLISFTTNALSWIIWNMASQVFNPMSFVDGDYRVCRRAKFEKVGSFKKQTVGSVVEFAYNMTFGSKGEHRHSRSGGTISRGNLEIFVNTFQGKLGEFAVANILYKHKDFKAPDLSTYELGIWEDADFQVGKNAIAVKSTKSYGNLILLESKDWDSHGNYIASVGEPRTYSHIVMVRIKPDTEEVLRNYRPKAEPEFSLSELSAHLMSLEWEYDMPGYIKNADLADIIKLKYLIPKGALLNGAVRMDAENYYIQAGDLRPIDGLISELI